MQLLVPNKEGKLTNVVVGMPAAIDYTSEAYQKLNFYLGATVGRYAGRISNGGFTLAEKFYPLENEITLHGGMNSFDKQIWNVESIEETENPYVIFSLESKEVANSFPGNLKVFAKYQLIENSLQITYTATTDIPTVLNITNHSYFNLDGKDSVLNNELFINADHVLETDQQLIPTGKLLSVKDSPFNYQKPKALKLDSNQALDTPFVFNEGFTKASLNAQNSGIEMQVTTNQPCLVVFTPEKFPTMGLRENNVFKSYPAICLECQKFPDAPNQSSFPNSVLLPGETYVNEIGYHFTMR